LLNAPKAGHEIFGLATDWVADQDLTIATFNELGVQAFPKENWRGTVERLNPDVIFAEYRLCGVEKEVLDWANDHNKIGLMNNHQPYIVSSGHDYPDLGWTRIYYLVSSKQKAIEATTRPENGNIGELTGRFPWPQERVFVLGASDLDFLTEAVETADVRNRLGVGAEQPLIGLFAGTAEYCDPDEIITLVEKCQDAGWQVIIHNHPLQRRVQSSEARDGFYVYDRKFVASQFWPKIQAMGARFIASYAPGRICGVEFHRCQSFELIRAADCVMGSYDVFFEAYALKKGYVLLSSEATYLVDKPPHKDFYDPGFELQDNFTKVQSVLERGNDIEQDPAFVEGWFHKLDGRWWKRALGVGEQLVRDNP